MRFHKMNWGSPKTFLPKKGFQIWKATLQKTDRKNSRIYFEMDFQLPVDKPDLNINIQQEVFTKCPKKLWEKEYDTPLNAFLYLTWLYDDCDNGLWRQQCFSLPLTTSPNGYFERKEIV